MSRDLKDNDLEIDISPQEPPPIPWWLREDFTKPAEMISKGDPSLSRAGLNQGLSASRWASDHHPIIPTRKEREMLRADFRRKQEALRLAQDVVPPHLREVPAKDGLPILTVDTNVPQDDNLDVVMGENTPTSPIAGQVLKDADGDIIMQDLDDPAVTSQINKVLQGERVGQAIPGVGAIPADPSSRPTVVKWVLVVDTSFILSHLHLVDNLVKAYTRWGNVVMLPWATIMELDGLKKSNSMIRHKDANGVETTVSVGMLARRANNWSFETMSKKAKGLWGQMKEEVRDSTAAKGDAAILDCCRYVKEVKRLPTAILSNDVNLCTQALIYEIRAVCFQGSNFTADGIMSILEGKGEPSYLPAGIWATTGDITKPVKEVQAPYYARAPDADRVKMGLYDSKHANGGTIKPRIRQPRAAGSRPIEHRSRSLGPMVEDAPMASYTAFQPRPFVEEARTVGSQIPAPGSDINRVKCHLAALLLRIEKDLLEQFIPLLKLYWGNLPEAERNDYPQLPESLANLEAIIWEVMQFSFDVVYPDHGTIRHKIRNGDLGFNWTSWIRWANPEQNMSSEVRPRKPTSTDLNKFIEDWEVLWSGIFQCTPSYFQLGLAHIHECSLASWKRYIDMFKLNLDG